MNISKIAWLLGDEKIWFELKKNKPFIVLKYLDLHKRL